MYTLHHIAPHTGACIHCGACLVDEDLKAMSAGAYYYDPETHSLSWPGLVEGETGRDCREVGGVQGELFVNT